MVFFMVSSENKNQHTILSLDGPNVKKSKVRSRSPSPLPPDYERRSANCLPPFIRQPSFSLVGLVSLMILLLILFDCEICLSDF